MAIKQRRLLNKFDTSGLQMIRVDFKNPESQKAAKKVIEYLKNNPEEFQLEAGETYQSVAEDLVVEVIKEERFIVSSIPINEIIFSAVLKNLDSIPSDDDDTKSLQEYLSNLNSADSRWGIWINPDNINDYTVAPFSSENGKYIWIGSLDKLSFGFQSQHDAIKQYLEENHLLTFKGKKVKVNQKEILQAWSDGNLDPSFSSFLEEKSQPIMKMWASYEAEEFVNNQLPKIIEQALEDAAQESPYSFV